MDNILLSFIISLSVVVIVCTITAIIRQIIINSKTKNDTVSASDNHIMDSKKYSGNYKICNSIEVADAEF